MKTLAHLSIALIAATLTVNVAADDRAADYLEKVKPLLAERCVACHGALKQEGGLRLDAATLIRQGGDSGAALIVGKPSASLLITKTAASDPDDRMPPEGEALSATQLGVLRKWIEGGAASPADEVIPTKPRDHWAFQPPARRNAPAAAAPWARNEIDRFIAAKHERHRIAAVEYADRATLLRRVYLDLIGVPPTRQQLIDFLNDDSPTAYDRVVDRLLESPQYGQRWARHWMDIWRYSDPSGYGKEVRDGRQHLWRWRDWIIDTLNEDKGYDRMIVEMLAADEAAPRDTDALRATGFLARNWYKFNRNVWIDNIIEHSSKAFLGVTANCARCHDHKYDPISQPEYYQLRAIFEAHDIRDDPHGEPGGLLVRAYDAHPQTATYFFTQGDERRVDKTRVLLPQLPSLFGGDLQIAAVQLPVESYYPALNPAQRKVALAAQEARVAKANELVAENTRKVEQARAKLASFLAAPNSKPATKRTPDAGEAKVEAKVLVSDDFAELDKKRWSVEGGDWSIDKGRLVQSRGETIQHRLLLKGDHPKDFRARASLRITGGEMWRSVGMGFDGRGKAMNAVYLSAFAGGSKIQATLQNSSGSWTYPQAGAKPHPLELNRDYQLELRVRGRTLNVLLDDQLLVAFLLPADRQPGHLSIWTFSASASFDEFQLSELPESLKLASAGPSPPAEPMTKDAYKTAVNDALAAAKIAHLHAEAAVAVRNSLAARQLAEAVKHGLQEGDAKASALAAGRAERDALIATSREQVARAEHQVATTGRKMGGGDAKSKKAHADAIANLAKRKSELAATEKRPSDGGGGYQPLGAAHPSSSTGRRLAYARWIASPENPLTARVAVNHIWLRHFDEPLVERTFDFGLRSPKPRHLALLDWLSVRFVEDGWSMKKLHKLIVTSGVYRLGSSPQSATSQTKTSDPDNRLYWRQNVRRMEAEVVRDSLLHVGGSLDISPGGPPIDHGQGQKVLRRSVYFRQDKERQMVFLSLFDGAKVSECYRRKTTVAPQQALAMFNSPLAASQSGRIAKQHDILDNKQFVTAVFEQVLGRRPTATEAADCVAFLVDLPDRQRARRQLALVLLNHNDFVTIR